MNNKWKWLGFLMGVALIISGVVTVFGGQGFWGVALIICGLGVNSIMDGHDIHPLLSSQKATGNTDEVSKIADQAPRTVQFQNGNILINDQPALVFAGEVHYFRLKREDWVDRLDKLKASGLDTVSTYIPWLWHELPDGKIDLVGDTHRQRDLIAFLELCVERNLNVLARPGPFVMAELKNEGVPYRVYREYPHICPISWNGEPISTSTLDYLAPDFLKAVKGWYAAVMPLLAGYQCTRGGPVIAVQLDNEIGMLSWVSNSPDLTDFVCEDMRVWSRRLYGDEVAGARVGADARDAVAWAAALRQPGQQALTMHRDLGLYMRDRFRRYVDALRGFAEEYGIKDVPFLINVHGTGGGRGRTFPIGISQLYESYNGQPQMTSGSDLYLGDLTVANVADLYIANAFMAAVLASDQPLTSLEFEAGTGNYGDDLGTLYTPESVQLKTLLCLAQGNRLLNYYLFAGGHNPFLEAVGDGIDRIAFTGERHGFAAPLGPEGQVNDSFHAIGQVVASLESVKQLLATSEQEHDGFALGFVPDHYLTEYRCATSQGRAEQVADLERFRGLGPRDILARALVLGGFSFPAVNLQTGVPKHPVVVLATGRTLGHQVQSDLAAYVLKGGKLLLVGLLPDCDDDGATCTVLADALGLRNSGRVEETGSPRQYWPCVAAHSWAAPRPEVRVTVAQLLASADGAPLSALLSEVSSGLPCAVQVRAGKGQAILLGCDYPFDLDFYRQLMAELSVVPRLQIDADGPGVILSSTISKGGERLLYILNVAPSKVTFTVRLFGQVLFGGRRIHMGARSGQVIQLPADGL